MQYAEGGRDRPRHYRSIATDYLLVVLAGAFVGLEKVVEQRLRGKRSIGFGTSHGSVHDRQAADADLLRQVTHEDLVTFGLIPELVGRIHTIVPLRPLGRADLVRILTDTPDSPVPGAQRWASLEGMDLRLSRPLLEAIADEAATSGLGARALQGLVSRVTRRAMYEVTADPRYRHRRPG